MRAEHVRDRRPPAYPERGADRVVDQKRPPRHRGDPGDHAVELPQPVDEPGDHDDPVAAPGEELLGPFEAFRRDEDVLAEPVHDPAAAAYADPVADVVAQYGRAERDRGDGHPVEPAGA